MARAMFLDKRYDTKRLGFKMKVEILTIFGLDSFQTWSVFSRSKINLPFITTTKDVYVKILKKDVNTSTFRTIYG